MHGTRRVEAKYFLKPMGEIFVEIFVEASWAKYFMKYFMGPLAVWMRRRESVFAAAAAVGGGMEER